MGELRSGAVTVLTALVVVGVLAVAAGFVMAGGGDRVDASVEKDYYTSESVVESAKLVEASGQITIDSPRSATVLIKHDGPNGEIEPITRALIRAGHEVRFYRGGDAMRPGESRLNRSLADADAFLVVGASGFTPADLNGIEAFADAGGRVVVVHDATAGGMSVGIPGIPGPIRPTGPGGAPADALTSRFGISTGEGYLYNMQENDENHKRVFASPAGGRLAEGVDRLVLDTASPVYSGTGRTVVTASDGTHYSVSRDADEFAVAVRSGDALVLGDTAMLTETNYNRADNEVFLGNVLTFLTSGTKVPSDAPMAQAGRTGPGGERPPRPPTRPSRTSSGG
jgi:hypothetical protein